MDKLAIVGRRPLRGELPVSGAKNAALPILAGTLVAKFGGVTNAALAISSIYIVGLFVPWFLPETVGKPLPQ